MLNAHSFLTAATGVVIAALITQPLAGCSGTTQALPDSSAVAQSQHAANPYNARLAAIPNVAKFLSSAERRGVPHNKARGLTRCSKNVYIYTSEDITGDLDVFCEDASNQGPNALVSQTANLAGWGVSVSPVKLPVKNHPCTQGSLQELLAVGTNAGTVNIYCNLSGGGYVQMNTAPLKLTKGTALGICFDSGGGIYANEFPYNTIDYFTNAQLVSGGSPTKVLTTNVNVVEFNLACDFDTLHIGNPSGENYLMAYGYDAQGNVNVTHVNTTSGAETVEQTLGNINSQTGFPGGLALDNHDDLVVNNQYGVMYAFNPELWNGPPVGTCRWGYPNDYINITFDDTQLEVWAADTNYAGGVLTTYGQSNHFPFEGSPPCSAGESGYQTQHPLAGEQVNQGIAVWPNRGV
jgi:hypothetical protein